MKSIFNASLVIYRNKNQNQENNNNNNRNNKNIYPKCLNYNKKKILRLILKK